MNYEENWKNDPEISGIPEHKLQFLQEMLFESKKYKGKELLPFFMSLAVKSRSLNITFSQEEIDRIIPVLKKHAGPEEILKMNQLITMMKNRQKG